MTWSADEILAQHGIPKTKMTTGKKEIPSSSEAEASQRRFATERKTKSQAALDKTKAGISSDTISAVESVKKQQHQARSVAEKGEKESASSQKVNSTENTKSKPVAVPANFGAAMATMTEEALELQYQGFRIISALMENDANYYLQEPHHADIVRTFRWLWHSKGRHLRLLHEELLPARYLIESKLVASVLIHYAKLRPSDKDILFDLLHIFLEQTTVDFSDVRRFLEDMVTSVLTSEDKKRVLLCFFSILESHRPEETKVLSIHYLVFPMLYACFTENAENTDPIPSRIERSMMPTSGKFIDKEMINLLVFHAVEQGTKCGEIIALADTVDKI